MNHPPSADPVRAGRPRPWEPRRRSPAARCRGPCLPRLAASGSALSSLTGRRLDECQQVLERQSRPASARHCRHPPRILTSLADLGFRHVLARHGPHQAFADWAAGGGAGRLSGRGARPRPHRRRCPHPTRAHRAPGGRQRRSLLVRARNPRAPSRPPCRCTKRFAACPLRRPRRRPRSALAL